MRFHWIIRIIVLTIIFGLPVVRSTAQQVAPNRQATDPDDRTPAEKVRAGTGDNIAAMERWHWKNVDSDFGPLPSSVHVYQTEDSLQGRPSVAYYISAPLKDRSLSFSTQIGYGKRLTPTEYYHQEQEPLVVINTSFFSFKTNENLNIVVRDGKMVSRNQPSYRIKGKDSTGYRYVTRGAFGISRKRKADVAWIYTAADDDIPYAFEDGPVVARGADSIPTLNDLHDDHWKRWKMETVVGAGPVLIHDGGIKVTNVDEGLFIAGKRDLNPRSAIGYTRDGRIIILAVQGRTPRVAAGVTLTQEAKILLDLGVYEAVNLDGGGSSCLLVNGKETIHPSDKEGERPVPSVFLIKEVR